MTKVLLFYKYVDIQYPKQIQKWQLQLCKDLNLKGRIILGHEGINGTVGGSEQDCESYKNYMLSHPLFNEIDFKENSYDGDCFAKLRVVVKDEIVTLGISPEQVSYKNTGTYLSPEQTHELLQNKPTDLIILDARNLAESDIGHFKDAVLADIKYFREFPDYIERNIDLFKDKKVLMYCTGGIRCERATAYLKTKDLAKEVMHIKGGIHRYIEKYPDGFFRGKNYVFDSRVTVKANNDVLGKCYICTKPADEYYNCSNAKCNKHFICCPDCIVNLSNCCSKECLHLIQTNQVKVRPPFKKSESTSCSI